MAIALATLEIGLKQAPQDGWLSPRPLMLFAVSLVSGWIFVRRTIKAAHPMVELTTLRAPAFAVGCALSFCLGVGLFGSVYLMPVFLAYVRRHDAFEIGSIMLVTGMAQLVTAPIAGVLESRLDPRKLSAMWLCAVCGWPRLERLPEPRCRFRRDVLAASRCAASPSCSACCRRRGLRSAR